MTRNERRRRRDERDEQGQRKREGHEWITRMYSRIRGKDFPLAGYRGCPLTMNEKSGNENDIVTRLEITIISMGRKKSEWEELLEHLCFNFIIISAFPAGDDEADERISRGWRAKRPVKVIFPACLFFMLQWEGKRETFDEEEGGGRSSGQGWWWWVCCCSCCFNRWWDEFLSFLLFFPHHLPQVLSHLTLPSVFLFLSSLISIIIIMQVVLHRQCLSLLFFLLTNESLFPLQPKFRGQREKTFLSWIRMKKWRRRSTKRGRWRHLLANHVLWCMRNLE